MMIVGNKADLQEKREVHTQRALNYAGRKNLPLYEVSAKDGLNIDLIFTRMA
jgi:Ras-related protein Rab-5C